MNRTIAGRLLPGHRVEGHRVHEGGKFDARQPLPVHLHQRLVGDGEVDGLVVQGGQDVPVQRGPFRVRRGPKRPTDLLVELLLHRQAGLGLKS